MSKQPRTVPSVADLATLAEKAIISAQRYLDDSRVLLDARSWPGAYANATLGIEEIGKATICGTMLALTAEDRAQFNFDKSFNSHVDKLSCAFLVLHLFRLTPTATTSEMLDMVQRTAIEVNSQKFRGLYVDYIDGAVREPSTEINEAAARARVADLSELVEQYAERYTAELLLEMTNAEGEGRDLMAGMAAQLLALLDGDEETAYPKIQAMFAGMADDTFDLSALIAEGSNATGRAARMWRP
jgi:AbiV family abortive infection protein